MAKHKISVTVEHATIRVEPDSLVMTSDDEVSWAGTNARGFDISFENDGPFASRRLAHAAALGSHRPRIRGRFKYSVTSVENPGLILDPVIIIEDPPTGQKP